MSTNVLTEAGRAMQAAKGLIERYDIAVGDVLMAWEARRDSDQLMPDEFDRLARELGRLRVVYSREVGA